MRPIERIFAEMVHRSWGSRNRTFFLVQSVRAESTDTWCVWAASRSDAMETVQSYNDWVAR